MTTLLEIEKTYNLHKAQLKFITSPAHYKAFIGGIGSGKTYVGCLASWLMAHENDESLGVIVAPSYPMLRDATMRTFFQICPEEDVRRNGWKSGDKELTLGNGSQILFRSASDPDALRGPNLDWFYFDEGSLAPTREAWDILIGRTRAKGKLNVGMVTCTPKGMNWVYDVFIENKKRDYMTVHATTLDNKRNLDPNALDSIISTYSGAFLRQEIYGEFVAFEGLVYPEFSIQTHINAKLFEGIKTFPRVIAGIDFGFTNPTVVLFIGMDNDERAYVLDEIYLKNHTLEQMMPELLDKAKRYNVESFFADPSSPDLIATLRGAGLRVKEANNDVLAGIMEITSRLIVQKDNKPRLYVHPRCVNTISEFQQYRYPEGKSGKNPDERPIKLFDHALDALRYALLTTKQAGKVSRFGNSVSRRRSW